MNEHRLRNQHEYDIQDSVVAVWWYTETGEVWDFRKCKQDGDIYLNRYVRYSDKENHQTLWERIIAQHEFDSARHTELLEKGYDYYERGYVIYNTMTMACEIWCIGSNLCSSSKFRKTITQHFGLTYERTDFYRIEEMNDENCMIEIDK